MNAPRPPAKDDRTPEQIAAGNRRALLGCGGILLVGLALAFGGLYGLRKLTAGTKGQNELCEDSHQCKPGFLCSSAMFAGDVADRCRQICEENSDCPSSECMRVLESQRTIGGPEGVCR